MAYYAVILKGIIIVFHNLKELVKCESSKTNVLWANLTRVRTWKLHIIF